MIHIISNSQINKHVKCIISYTQLFKGNVFEYVIICVKSFFPPQAITKFQAGTWVGLPKFEE